MQNDICISKRLNECRGVVPGGAGGAMAPLDFGRSANLISQPGGADYAHQITIGTPGFQTFLRPWNAQWDQSQFEITSVLQANLNLRNSHHSKLT